MQLNMTNNINNKNGGAASADPWPTLDWLANKKPKKEKPKEDITPPEPPPQTSKKPITPVIIEEAKIEEGQPEEDVVLEAPLVLSPKE
jgi:hypothetical protein